ncbi:MAG: ABC transporter permease [Chloroflexi bacterium]|nr:ABC transporter permease [Chloroflexota bacterium]
MSKVSEISTQPQTLDSSFRVIKGDSLWALAWRRFRHHRLAMFGATVFIIVITLAIIAPVVAPIGPDRQDLRRRNEAPSVEHLLGTDPIGRDVWARLVYGARVSMSVGVVAVSIYVTIGVILGAISGFVGGWVDILLQRVTETVMTFPTLMIILTIVSLIGPSIYNVFLVIGLLSWPGVTRLVRGEFLSLTQRDFVLAAHCLGVPQARIIFRHILPNALAPVIVAATLGVAGAILTETGLSFLGLGVQPPTPSWGNMIADAQSLTVLESRPWQWIPPGLAIALSVLCINFIGDGLRDALDPRMHAG